MYGSEINWWAVLVAGVAYWVLAALWYSVLFGKTWLSAVGMTEEQAKKEGSAAKMIVGLIAGLIVVYGMARIMTCMAVVSITNGVLLGLLISICLLAPTVGLNVLFEGRPTKLFWINAMYNIVGLVIAGVILGAWA